MQLDHKNKRQFITIPRVASYSIRAVYPETGKRDYEIIAFIRHPWERIVSALMGPCHWSSDPNERLTRYWDFEIVNSHVRPQSDFLVNVDSVYSLSKINEVIPGVAHENKTENKIAWQDYPIAFDQWKDRYKQDFDLWLSLN